MHVVQAFIIFDRIGQGGGGPDEDHDGGFERAAAGQYLPALRRTAAVTGAPTH